MEQLSFISETLQEKIAKQMKIALKRGIIPGAVVIFDGDNKCKYVVMNLFINNEDNLAVKLISNNCMMSYKALSERLSAVEFYK